MQQENKEIKISAQSGQTFEIDDLAFDVKKVQGVRVKAFDSDGNMDIFTWPECQVGTM